MCFVSWKGNEIRKGCPMVRKSYLLILPIIILVGGIILSQSGSQNPHGQLKWDCQDCHTADSWTKMKESPNFDHSETGFALNGAHASAKCIGCHQTPTFAHVATECSDCHSDHHKGQLGTQCQTCHTPQDWKSRREVLSIHLQRGFPLVGAHATADCEMCHTGASQQQFAGTSSNCFDCHSGEFASATDPNHTQNNFDHDCTKCHSSGSWNPARFDHASTGFPLTGRHQPVACITCHPTSFVGTSSDCYTCHQTAFAATTNPNHVQSNFSHDCLTCHTTNGWVPSSFNHAATAFPLTGKHQTAACISCHPTTYAGTTSDCYTCHRPAFEATSNPNHAQANFSHDCVSCHTTNGWVPSNFNHAATAFPLTGRHQTVACITCHATTYAGTTSDCYTCHQTAFAATTNPSHVQLGFSHDCLSCHTTNGWAPSSFNHATTAFPLTGQHVTTPCLSCHASGYVGTSTTCVSCHQTDYTATSDPNHTSAGFSTDCKTCHSTGAWAPSTWNHDAQNFPIYSGPHAGIWNNCVTCHTNPATYADFTCFSCHKHNQTDTDASHREVNGYAYTSSACYSCHPRGRTR
jgi:hypothetical protein